MNKVFAHRGFSSRYPENTMSAFRAALAIGADGLEFDVQLSRDGVPVIIHDESLLRTGGVDRAVEDCDLSELREIDVSYRQRGTVDPQPVPTLEEYFDLVEKADFITNIEPKTGIRTYPGIERKVTEMVRAFGLEDRIIFSSFNHYTLLTCKQLMPAVPCGILYDCRIVRPCRYAAGLGFDYIHPWEVCMTPEELSACGEDSMRCNPWTVDDPNRLRELLASPAVYAVITNKPDLALQIRGGSKD